MPFNVLYAWQMDTDTKLNRWFIDRAIKDAIKLIKRELADQADLKFDDAPPVDDDEPTETDPNRNPVMKTS